MKKILVIEDNAEVRENTAEIIELSNYKVITAADGKAGVEMALREKPDLIICDIMMPQLDGYGVHHSLSKHKETATIPFIFLTAKSEKADFRKGMDMGADDYIMKPFEGIDLLHAIEVRLHKETLLKEKYAENTHTAFLDTVKLTGKVLLNSEDRDIYNYNKKVFIFKEGQYPRSVYYIVSGKIKISRSNDDGKEFITNIYGPGEYFGYNPVLENENYKDEAQALEETQLMHIPNEDFFRLISSDVDIARAFIKIISQNVTGKEESLLHMAYSSLRKKVAYGLLLLADKYKTKEDAFPVLNLSREHMAQSIGIATESLIRTLGDFKEEKLISLQAGKVVITDEKKLRNLPY